MKFISAISITPEFIRFIIVGGVNTLLSYVIYVSFLLFLPYPVAYTLAYIIAIFISYYLNTKFVFKRKARLSKALQFPLVYLAQYLVGFGSLYILVEILSVSEFIAPVLVVMITIPVTFILSRLIIKGHLRSEQ
jgi:putative flippase GtrA